MEAYGGMEAGRRGRSRDAISRQMDGSGGYNGDDDDHRPVLARVMLPAKNVG